MEFLVVFSERMELHFLALRKRKGLNRIIWWEVSDASGPGSGYVSTRNMAAELPVMIDVLAEDLENKFFREDDDDFIFSVDKGSRLHLPFCNQ